MSTDDKNKNILRNCLEATGWAVLIAILWGTDLLAKISERNQTGFGKNNFLLISEQITSAVAVLIMVLFVVRWLKLFPLKRDVWVQAVIGHTAGSILFAFGHHGLMVAFRIPWYEINGHDYMWREPFVSNLIVEYQKDIKIYLGLVVVATAYQLYLRSRSAPLLPRADRLVVQTGTGDSVLRFEQIDYLEAAMNYIAVHAEGREYVVRDTMDNLFRRLSSGPFARTHRSFIVNIDKIREIRPVDSKQRIVLHSGADLPLSRSYREEFGDIMAGGSIS